MTVSNVLSGRRRVREQTREAVLNAAKELDYRPSLAARALASGTEIRVGLLYSHPENEFVSSLLLGALAAAARSGAHLVTEYVSSNDAGSIAKAIDALAAVGASGLLIPAPLCEILNRSRYAQSLRLPAIGIATGKELRHMASIRIDDSDAARQLTQLLIGQGHKRIALVGGPKHHFSSAARRSGYLKALEESGLAYDPALDQPGNFEFNSGAAAAVALLDLEKPPTAVFALNDDMAAGVVFAAHRRGLHLPQDLAVAGFDDAPIATKIWPALTTVRQPIREMTERATEALVASLRGDGESPSMAQTIYLPFEIIERESTRAAGPQFGGAEMPKR